MNTHIIYKLTFPNGKVYIGQTINFYKRMNQYKNLSKSIGRFVKNAIKKCGWESVKQEILFTVSEEFVDELETKMIAKYNSADKKFGYNILKIGNSPKGFKPSEKTKKLMSKSHLNKKHTEESKEKMKKCKQGINHPQYGTHQSKETIRKRTKNLLKPITAYKGGKFVQNFNSITEASNKLSLNLKHISHVLTNKRKHTKGYTFIYA